TQNNEIHLCEATRHYCGEPCLLKTETGRQEHQCPKECEDKGICKIVTEPTAVEAKYENAHDSFIFTKKPHHCDSNCPNDKGQHIKEEENKQNFHFYDIRYDREKFKKIDRECPDEEYQKFDENSGVLKFYYTQNIFHARLDPPNNKGYISIDDHHFTVDIPDTCN
ncbi:6688_t:CDS:2, partial [Diversispora eburnea]